MANPKPVDEIRIGRVRLRFGGMEPKSTRGTTSPSRVSTRTAMNSGNVAVTETILEPVL